jgi:hypothetical protein
VPAALDTREYVSYKVQIKSGDVTNNISQILTIVQDA